MQSTIFSFPSEGSGNRTASRMAFSSMPRASMIEGASSVSSSTISGPPTTDGLCEDVVDVSDELAHRATVLVAAPVLGVRLLIGVQLDALLSIWWSWRRLQRPAS